MKKEAASEKDQFDLAPLTLAVLADFGLDIRDIQKITRGYQNQVYQATLDGERIYLRLNENSKLFSLELLGYAAFREQGIPVPDLIAYQEQPPTIGLPTMIMKAARGTEISKAQLSPAQTATVYEHLGVLVRSIHLALVSGFGLLEEVQGALQGTSATWKDYWDSESNLDRQELHFLTDHQVVTAEEARHLERLHEELAALHVPQASLLHQDINKDHIFVTGDHVSGVIDLGRVMAGDPRYDIAMSLLFQDEREQVAFKAGYGELAYDPVVHSYLTTIAAGKVEWSIKLGLPERRAQAIETFRQVLPPTR